MRLVPMREVRARLRGVIGRDLAYRFAKRYGVRLGTRFFVPEEALEALLQGRVSLEGPGKEGERGE